MSDKIKITYLLNSGFLVESSEWALVFDDYRDVRGDVDRVSGTKTPLYFFVSHAHFDHFSPMIARYNAKRFFISEDVRALGDSRRFPVEKTTWLGKYDNYSDDFIKVTSFDSTDEGTSFLVEISEWRIFHAGDFNWWHWSGDTPENIGFARNGFFKQMKRLENMEFDAAFFPADGRLEEARSWGAREFCRKTDTRAFITMHSVGYPKWEPEPDFFDPGKKIPYWSPTEPGEHRILERGGNFS